MRTINNFFNKHDNIRRCTCAFLLLYMVHAFSITSLIASSFTSHQSMPAKSFTSISTTKAGRTHNNTIPIKRTTKPYSLFIAKHGMVKFTRVSEKEPVVFYPVQRPVLPNPKAISSNLYSAPIARHLCDDAYKRYRLLSVFLI